MAWVWLLRLILTVGMGFRGRKEAPQVGWVGLSNIGIVVSKRWTVSTNKSRRRGKWVQYTSTESRPKVVMSAVCASVADTANVVSNATYRLQVSIVTGRAIR